MKKFLSKVKGNLKKIVAVATAAALSILPVCASEGTNIVSPDDFTGVLDALTAQISVSSIVGVLVVLVGATVGLAFMWWGVRKLVRALMAAFKKGKVSI